VGCKGQGQGSITNSSLIIMRIGDDSKDNYGESTIGRRMIFCRNLIRCGWIRFMKELAITTISSWLSLREKISGRMCQNLTPHKGV